MDKVTKELVISSLLPEITRLNLDQLINVCREIKPTMETLAANYSDFRKLREMYQLIKKRRESEDAPLKEIIKTRKEGYDTYLKPMEEILEAADEQISVLYFELKALEAKEIENLKSISEIRGRHVEFVNEIVKAIVAAPDAADLTRIQKLVGSEKSKSKFYEDFQPTNERVCDAILALIAERKKIIKENSKLQKEYDTWYAAGDLVKATQLKEQMELSEKIIVDNARLLAEEAYQQVRGISKVDMTLDSSLITPRLHRWSWIADDIEQMFKKMPQLVEKVPNKKTVNAFMKEKVDSEELSKDHDNKFDGLIIHWKPFFVAIKTYNDDAS